MDAIEQITLHQTAPQMLIICSWCHKVIGVKPGPDGMITHTICPECERKMMEE